MIKNLIFDFGGVVVDIYWEEAVKHFKELGLANADVVLDKYKQNGIFLELEEGKIDSEQFRAELSKMCGRELSQEETESGWLGFFKGVPVHRLKTLEQLHRKYKMYLLSNTNPYVMNWARSERFSEMGKGLDYFFDKLYMSYQMGVTKPSLEIFRKMIDDSHIVPEESLFVDDGPANIEAARSLGFDTLLVKEVTDWTETIASLLKTSI